MIFDGFVLAVVAYALLAWGANETWAIAIVGIAAVLLATIRVIKGFWNSDIKIRPVSVFLPLILFLFYIFLQWQYWSVEPHSTGLYGILTLSCVGVVFLGTYGTLSRKNVKRLLIAILVVGAFEAVYGLIQYLGGYEYIWNYRRISGMGVATGTLINRNHYALVMNMFISAAIGYLYYRTERVLQQETFSLRTIIQLPGYGKLLWILVWIVVMGLGVVFSMSRMGIAALFGSLAVMILTAKAAYSKKRVTVIGFILVFGIMGLAVYTGVDEVIARYEALSDQWQSDRDRAALWKDAWVLVEEHPLLGSGLGTFQWTYPAHEKVQPDVPARYAHNDYLQAQAEVGVTGLVLLLCAFAAVWRIAYRNFKYSPDPLVRGIGLGTVGALTAVALQELTDFGLYIPGVALTAALLAGVNLRVYDLELRDIEPDTEEF